MVSRIKYLFLFIFPLLSLNHHNRKLNLYSYDITIKIRGSGKQRIISTMTSVSCPNEIYYFNGILIGNNTCEIDFVNEENVIIMKWNNKISGVNLFSELTSVTEVDLSHLISLGGMLDMFNGCTSLTSINFSNLDTSSTSGSIARLFKNCYSLKSLDLSKLDLSNVVYFDSIFDGCKSLEYINFINYDDSKVKLNLKPTIGKEIPSNLVICINQEKASSLYNSLNKRDCTLIYCEENWRERQNKIISETNECVSSCENDYSYEFENKCYKNCPNGTRENNFICEKSEKIQIISTQIFEKKTEFYFSTNNSINYSFNLVDSTIIIEEINEEIKVKDETISKFQKEIQEGILDNVLKNITENKEDFSQKVNDIIYQITTSENQKNKVNKNISSIELGECENILKDAYNINESTPLIIFKIDYFSEDALIPIIGYEIYHPLNKSKLDLFRC